MQLLEVLCLGTARDQHTPVFLKLTYLLGIRYFRVGDIITCSNEVIKVDDELLISNIKQIIRQFSSNQVTNNGENSGFILNI